MRRTDNAYMNELYSRLQRRGQDDGWCFWFTGVIDGEGSFTYNATRRGTGRVVPIFYMGLQRDTYLMQQIVDLIGLGKTNFVQPKVKRRDGGDFEPRMNWRVSAKDDLVSMVTFLEVYPLRSKKLEEFAIWKLMVRLYSEDGSTSIRMKELALALSNTNNKVSGNTLPARAKLKSMIEEQRRL